MELGPDAPFPARPLRVLVAGASGAGKTTVAARVGRAIGVPHVEIDALFHGPGWMPRDEFAADVADLAARTSWVTEWQYDAARALLAQRAELVVWLDLPRSTVMRQVTARTVGRALRRQKLWNGNRERPLRTIFTDPEHIVRWAWNTHALTTQRVAELLQQRPNLPVVRLRSRRQVRRWLAGAASDEN